MTNWKTPNGRLQRSRRMFAWWPQRLDDGSWAWLTTYEVVEEFTVFAVDFPIWFVVARRRG